MEASGLIIIDQSKKERDRRKSERALMSGACLQKDVMDMRVVSRDAAGDPERITRLSCGFSEKMLFFLLKFIDSIYPVTRCVYTHMHVLHILSLHSCSCLPSAAFFSV